MNIYHMIVESREMYCMSIYHMIVDMYCMSIYHMIVERCTV